MTARRPPKAPAGLGAAGAAMWRSMWKRYEFDVGEVPLLELACAQLDDVRRLEKLIERQGLTVAGSVGQERLNPAVGELRQARLAVGRHLGALALPIEEDERPMTEAQRRARKAAAVRWADHRRPADGAP